MQADARSTAVNAEKVFPSSTALRGILVVIRRARLGALGQGLAVLKLVDLQDIEQYSVLRDI